MIFLALSMIVSRTALAQTSINWSTAIRYAELVKIAENVEPASDYSATDKQAISAQGYTYLQTVYGSDLTTDATPTAGNIVSYGFLALSSSGELIAILRGTDTILEWIDDAQFYFVSNPIKGSLGFTEEGFTSIYKSLRMGTSSSSETLVNAVKDYLNAEKATTVSGHSLGGALATLLTLDVAHNSKLPTPVVYTYASPHVGDYLFKDDYNDTVATSYRMYNSTDAVPDMPLWPYTSVKTGFKLTPDTSKVSTSIACSHHLTTYLWLMGQQAGVDSDCVVSE
jgi:predicted lipase